MVIFMRLMSLTVAAVFWMIVGGLTVFLLTMCMTLVGAAVGPVYIYGGPGGALLLLIVIGVTARRRRQRRAMLVLGQLEQAVRLNLPLPGMLRAAEASEGGKMRRRFAGLRDAIEAGRPLGEAVSVEVPELSTRAVSLIAAGERVGQLPATFTRLLADDRRARGSEGPEHALSGAYALFLLLALMFMISGISFFILPEYREVFEDFDIPLPWMTQITFSTLSEWSTVLLVLAVLLAMAAAGRAAWQVWHRPDRRPLPWALLADWLLWCVPGVRALVRDRGLADGFYLVTDSLRAGLPLEAALHQASALPMNAVVRRRLRRLADHVQQGHDLSEAARDARLPALVSGMLGMAATGGDAARTFAFLARYYRHRFTRLVTLARAAMLPVIVLGAALLVGWVVLAMFLPLVHLIEAVTVDALNAGRL